MRIEARSEEWQGVGELAGFLRGVVGSRCRDENEVDDVVQEACLRAARYRHGLAREESLRPWAARIALNVLAGRVRRRFPAGAQALSSGDEREPRAPEPEDPEPGFLRTGPWVLEREAALALLEVAVAELCDEDQRLLRAFYGGGESCRHAARACEVPPGLVKGKLFRARRRLSRILRRLAALEARSWVAPDGTELELSRRRSAS